jgi:hypothetical protein
MNFGINQIKKLLFQVASITAHDYRRSSMREYRPAKKRITVGGRESVRIIRKIQKLSQHQLSRLTDIPQPTVSAAGLA